MIHGFRFSFCRYLLRDLNLALVETDQWYFIIWMSANCNGWAVYHPVFILLEPLFYSH